MPIHQKLIDEFQKLSYEKVGKALSFIRFLEQEDEPELYMSSEEEKELHDILEFEEFIDSSEMLALIEAMPDD